MNDFDYIQEDDFDYENGDYYDDAWYEEYGDSYVTSMSLKNRLKWWAWKLRMAVMWAPFRITHRCVECGKPGFPYCKDHEIPF